MHYTREQQKRFLDKELVAISENYLKLLNSKAIALLSTNEVYVTQFIKLDFNRSNDDHDGSILGNGQLMLRFKREKGIPRKNEYFTAVILEENMGLPKMWGELSWGKLRSHQVQFSEVHCVWQGKTDDNGYLICGFSGVSIEMTNYLQKNKLEGCVIVLGPHEPPIDYYQNLINIVSNVDEQMPARELLDFDVKTILWAPKEINSDSSQVPNIISTLDEKKELVFQGPPGTGKTFLMAELVAQLLERNKSVLVTAMTNRALIELAEKDSLHPYLEKGCVMKTNVSSDEILSCKYLIPIDSKELTCIPGKLTLATFYNSSGWAKNCYREQPFDVVIMDEASQSLFAMIAACKNLGENIIWIGDQNQMQPIVLLSDEAIARNDYYMLANGFRTLCCNFDFESYILSETHRLLPASSKLTSLFYHIPLRSAARFEYSLEKTKIPYVPSEGGCKIIFKDMPNGEKADRDSCLYAVRLIGDFITNYPKLKIAVLSKFRATVRMLQNCFISQYGNRNTVLIDTIERVQGMTCDVCVFFIPNTMMNMSLDRALFNVATSRAKQLTLIVADKSIMHSVCDKAVHLYLKQICSDIQEDNSTQATSLEATLTNGTEIKLVVKGKIDLTRFERAKKEIKKDKINLYIIDTNVFVNCPDIISKIPNEYEVVLSAKVVDELDKLKIKLSEAEKINVQKALRVINQSMDKRRIRMITAKTELLPEDFDKKSPDNMILSVALQFREENPIILTSDNGLQVKAKGLGISTISLKKFLKS